MSHVRAFWLSMALAVVLGLMVIPLLAPLELTLAGSLIPVALLTPIAMIPYMIAEVRRADRENRSPRR